MALNPPITDWTGKVVWIVGASSGIGRATASALHRRGARVAVSARNGAALDAFASAHAGALVLPLDVTDAAALRSAALHIDAEAGGIELALYCAGRYSAQRADAYDLQEMLAHQQVNVVGALNFLDVVLPRLLARAATGRPAHLSLVASVAGYRGLPHALAYGPTKAALINLAETLYLDLAARRIGVSVINPGFVATPLTAHNHFPMPALLSPEQAAEQIIRGWARGSFEIHFPKRFTVWLKAMRHLNDGLYFAAVRRATGT